MFDRRRQREDLRHTSWSIVTYYFSIFGSTAEGFACAEIETEQGNLVGRVHDSESGWQVQQSGSAPADQTAFEEAVALAKQELLYFPNRRGSDPPPGLSAVGLSLWLMERSDVPEDEGGVQ